MPKRATHSRRRTTRRAAPSMGAQKDRSKATVQMASVVVVTVIIELLGMLALVLARGSVALWYAALIKPSFTPPVGVFAVAWAIILALVSAATYAVWTKGVSHPGVPMALSSFGMQLTLSVLWIMIFFGMRAIFFGFITSLLLWIAILMNIAAYKMVSNRAAMLMVPYIIWITFIVVFNAWIWILN